jgi:hypothetical protein
MSAETGASGSANFAKLFTVEEANALLPRLKPAVEEMLRIFKEIRDEIEEAADRSGVPVGSPDLPGQVQDRGIAPRLFERIKGIIDSIQEHGCIVNGPEAGLIDFPALYASEIVFLCWKFGEQGVNHWHRIPDGFAGRRPLLDTSDEGSGVH